MILFVYLLIAVISAFIMYSVISVIMISIAVQHINGPPNNSIFLQIIRQPKGKKFS
jgi:hypothetical protein